jgi:polyphosphate glucokinase
MPQLEPSLPTASNSEGRSNGAGRARHVSITESPAPLPPQPTLRLLSIDIGGTKIKALASGETEPRKFASGREMTPRRMMDGIRRLTSDWDYDAVSIGFPGEVGPQGPRGEPGNLGSGWVGFDFAAAFEKPVRILNDAAMQALGSYEEGRMLFLSLGTGVGSALVANGVIVHLELGRVPIRKGRTIGEVLGRRGLKLIGKRAWRKVVAEVVPLLMDAFLADYVVLGGGNAKLLREPPPGTRIGHNLAAFRGGFRLWHLDDAPTHEAGRVRPVVSPSGDWRLI